MQASERRSWLAHTCRRQRGGRGARTLSSRPLQALAPIARSMREGLVHSRSSPMIWRRAAARAAGASQMRPARQRVPAAGRRWPCALQGPQLVPPRCRDERCAPRSRPTSIFCPSCAVIAAKPSQSSSASGSSMKMMSYLDSRTVYSATISALGHSTAGQHGTRSRAARGGAAGRHGAAGARQQARAHQLQPQRSRRLQHMRLSAAHCLHCWRCCWPGVTGVTGVPCLLAAAVVVLGLEQQVIHAAVAEELRMRGRRGASEQAVTRTVASAARAPGA